MIPAIQPPAKFRSFLILLTLVVVSLACSSTEEPTDLEKNRSLWESNQIDTYQYRFERICFCNPRSLAGTVRVRGDSVHVVEDVKGDGEPLDSFELEAFRSIADLFDILEVAEMTQAHRIDVTYDKRLGYPLDIFIDYREGIADEEIGFNATEFLALR